MKKVFFTFLQSILVFFVAISCSSGPTSTTSETATADSAASTSVAATLDGAPPAETIQIRDARKMVELFNRELNSGNSMTRYVSKDIESLKRIIAYFEGVGKTHVKFYFGMDKYETSPGDSVPRLTLFFEGATGIEHDPDLTNPTLNDDRGDKVLPCNVVFPCPPPSCKGYSRYYPE